MAKRTMKAMATNDREARLAEAARALVELLGEETAAAVAAKCQPTYTRKAADVESARLAEAIVNAIGVGRYNALDIL